MWSFTVVILLIFQFKNIINSEELGKKNYKNHQIWKICDKSISLLDKALTRNFQVWNGNHTCMDILVEPSDATRVKNQMSSYGISYSVLVNDLQELIDTENPQPLGRSSADKLTWTNYYRLEKIYEFLEEKAKAHPDIVTLETIGHSFEGRPMKVMKISNKKPENKVVWIDGGIHAREWISPATVTYIINELLKLYEDDATLASVDWYFLPVINPDGYEYTHEKDRFWRKNRRKVEGNDCVGTDLNRNFGYHWGGKGTSEDRCSDLFKGDEAFSEPESQTMRDYMSKNVTFDVYISYHSYGQFILFSWAYDEVLSDDFADLSRVAKKAVWAIENINGPTYTSGTAATVLYPAAGGSDDWAKGSLGVKYAYTIELRDDGIYGFDLPASFILQTAKEGFVAMYAIVNEIITNP